MLLPLLLTLVLAALAFSLGVVVYLEKGVAGLALYILGMALGALFALLWTIPL